MWPNQGAAANGLSAVRSGVAGNRERTARSTRAAEAVAELGSFGDEEMSLSRVLAITAIALLGGNITGSSHAADAAGGPYRELLRGMNVDFARDPDSLPPQIKLQVRSKLLSVKPEDIRFSLNGGNESHEIPVASDGTFMLPISRNLFEADAHLVSNQPKGTLEIKADVQPGLQDLMVPFSDHVREGRISYEALAQVAIAGREKWIEKKQKLVGEPEVVALEAGDASSQWILVVRVTQDAESANAEIIDGPPQTGVGPLRKGFRNLLGKQSPIKKAAKGEFVIPYTAALLKQNPTIALSPNPTWECAIGAVPKSSK